MYYKIHSFVVFLEYSQSGTTITTSPGTFSSSSEEIPCPLPPSSSPCYASVLFIVFSFAKCLNQASNSLAQGLQQVTFGWLAPTSSCMCHSPQVISSKSSIFILLDSDLFYCTTFIFWMWLRSLQKKAHTHRHKTKHKVCLFKMNFFEDGFIFKVSARKKNLLSTVYPSLIPLESLWLLRSSSLPINVWAACTFGLLTK